MMECAGALMLAAAFLIAAEVLLRQVFHLSIPGVDELAGFTLAVGATWSFALAMLDKAHIRIDTLYERFGRPMRAVLDIVALAGLVGFLAPLTWYASTTFHSSVSYGATSQSALASPLAVPQGLWLLGLVWFLFVVLLLLARCIAALARRDLDGVTRLAGVASAQEELDAELADAARRRRQSGDAP